MSILPPEMDQTVQEPDGKWSFARLAGALMVLSVIVGYWIELLGIGEMPDLTVQLLGTGFVPYLGNKVTAILKKP